MTDAMLEEVSAALRRTTAPTVEGAPAAVQSTLLAPLGRTLFAANRHRRPVSAFSNFALLRADTLGAALTSAFLFPLYTTLRVCWPRQQARKPTGLPSS